MLNKFTLQTDPQTACSLFFTAALALNNCFRLGSPFNLVRLEQALEQFTDKCSEQAGVPLLLWRTDNGERAPEPKFGLQKNIRYLP